MFKEQKRLTSVNILSCGLTTSLLPHWQKVCHVNVQINSLQGKITTFYATIYSRAKNTRCLKFIFEMVSFITIKYFYDLQIYNASKYSKSSNHESHKLNSIVNVYRKCT